MVASRAAETFSLVAAEALACETPVVAFRRGALPDVVKHGETGFLAHAVGELAEGIRRAPAIDGRARRADAERRFPLGRTIERYMTLYTRLVAGDA